MRRSSRDAVSGQWAHLLRSPIRGEAMTLLVEVDRSIQAPEHAGNLLISQQCGTQPTSMLKANKTRLNIVICGGGIAGLAAAGALAPHHDVTVLERKPDIHEGAYGINLKPNASLVAIELLGIEVTPPPSSSSLTSFEAEAEAEAGGGLRGVPCCEVMERSAEDGVEQMRIGVDAETMFGAPWYLCRRDELLQQLYRTARQRGVDVRLDVSVRGLEQENTTDGRASGPVSIQTSNGETVHADLVLVADGIASKLRRYVLDGRGSVPNGLAAPGSASTKDALIVDSGQVAFRALVAWTDLAGDATLSYLTRPSHGGLYVWAGRKQRLVVYPCPGSVNIVAIVDKDALHPAAAGASSVPSAATAEVLRDQFSTFHSSATRLLDHVRTASLWALNDLEPLARSGRGCVYLVGDASHATLPHQGQGASLAFEDAEALATMLADLDDASPTTIGSALHATSALRTPRIRAIQHASRVMARPADYAKGEKGDALRFSQLMLKYKGINDLAHTESKQP